MGKESINKWSNFFHIGANVFVLIFFLYLILIVSLVSLETYFNDKDLFFNTIFFLMIEVIFIFSFLIYYMFTSGVMAEILIFLPSSLIGNIYLSYKKKKLSFEHFKLKYVETKRLNKFIIVSIIPSSIILIMASLYFTYNTNSLIYRTVISEYVLFAVYYILIINIVGFFSWIGENNFESIKTKYFNFLNYKYIIIALTAFLIAFGFAGIEVEKLNNEDLMYKSSILNCSYPTASMNVLIVNQTIYCNFSRHNMSNNYSIVFENRYAGVYNKSYLNITNNTFSFKVINKENSYNTSFFENDKIKYEVDLNVVSYDKYLSSLETIEERKNSLFIGAWVFFFASIIFLIQIDSWYNHKIRSKKIIDSNEVGKEFNTCIDIINNKLELLKKINLNQKNEIEEQKSIIKETKTKLKKIIKKLN